jgi:hypothetical protein
MVGLEGDLGGGQVALAGRSRGGADGVADEIFLGGGFGFVDAVDELADSGEGG